jgi:hypothetical protein
MPDKDISNNSSASAAVAAADDWTFEHIRTLVTWLNYSNVNLFLIDMSIRYFKMILSHVMAYTLLFSTISSTISISQLGISQEKTPTLYNSIQYTFIAASTLSTLLIGYVKLFKVQESLDANALLYKQWLTFSTRISSEFQMPVHMRTSALELLQDMKNEYIDLFCRNANIPFPVQRSANAYFQRNLGSAGANRTGCWSRPNYIKRTNVFFIFQDIIKNEIKRLSAELTPIQWTGNPGGPGGPGGQGDQDRDYENVVPSYYRGPEREGNPKYIGPQAIIEYKYDGPFIVIEVIDRDDSQAFVRQKVRRQAAQRRATLAAALAQPHERRKSTFLQRIKKATADDTGESVAPDTPAVSRRERQMSFSLPERSILQQSVVPARRSFYGSMPTDDPHVIETHRRAAAKAAAAAKARAETLGGDIADAIIGSQASDESVDSASIDIKINGDELFDAFDGKEAA